MKRYRGVWASALLLLLMTLAPQGSADVTVISTSISPTEPTPDDAITVSVEVENITNISKVYLTYCEMSPFLCYPPKEMKYIGGGVYSVDAGKFKEGEWKYNITTQLKDGNITWTPDTHFFVKKQTPGNGGDHNNTTTGNGTVKDNKIALYVMYGAVVSMVIITVVAAAVVLGQRMKGPEGP